MRRAACLAVLTLLVLAACSDEKEEETAPVAPPSRHAALRDALVADAKAFAFASGD